MAKKRKSVSEVMPALPMDENVPQPHDDPPLSKDEEKELATVFDAVTPLGPASFRVVLPDNPELTVEAPDEAEALAEYMRRLGILGTRHAARIERA